VRTSRHARRALLALGLALLLAACATPVGVTRVDTQASYHRLTSSAVATGRASEYAERVLRRNLLQARFEEQPAEALAALHKVYVRDGGNDRLITLAELSFLHAEKSGDRSYYLAAAVYAYALLFPGTGRPPTVDVASHQYRLVYDIYNFGLAEGLRRADGGTVDLTAGPRALPFGTLEVTVADEDFVWLGYRLENFVSATSLDVRGLRNRYWRSGVGAALVAGIASQEAIASIPGARRIGHDTRLAVTAVLRMDDPRGGIASGSPRGRLELYPEDRTRTVVIDGREEPLESDTTAALALWLEHSAIWNVDMRGLLQLGALEWIPRDRADDGMFLLEPFRTDRIPVVLVHGTASNPARWAELVNELRGDPRIRDRYQLWLFLYETGAPIGYSAGRLRRALERTLSEVDPTGIAPALHRMVVIGHSQGGLLTKLTVVDSGDRFWQSMTKVTPESLDTLDVDPHVREIMRQSLTFTPEPFIERVVFVATPHRGSFLAGWRLGQFGSWLAQEIRRLNRRTVGSLTHSEEAQVIRMVDQLPTSIDDMSPSNPFIKTLAEIPVVPGVRVNSIVAVKGEGPPYDDGDDGVVQYRSAHLDGVESELVVDSEHSVQGNPVAIEEIRRILLEHAAARHP
jgi:pimeloyl-ACP methyl ester carboxylesterase